MSRNILSLPPQKLPLSKKKDKWRKMHLDWADENSSVGNSSLVRNTVKHKKINYDLFNGKIHMEDMMNVLNPTSIEDQIGNEKIQHYPIMNSKLNVLIGEESKRIFDARVVITNPNAITEIEEKKKAEIMQMLMMIIQNTAQSEDEAKQALEDLADKFTYDWQDLREQWGNEILNHYSREQRFAKTFNDGFTDAIIVGEEIYQCDIVAGEPTLEKLDPLKVRAFSSGASSKIEDADVIVIEDYWPVGKVYDVYYQDMTESDRKKIEDMINEEFSDDKDNGYYSLTNRGFVSRAMEDGMIEATDVFSDFEEEFPGGPIDAYGNIKVLRMYWKSRRKIKKIKFFDPNSGEESSIIVDETYEINKNLGEEEEILYINEAWEGTKIGGDIYINIRPRPIQYNRLSNPSRCHFGIIGSVYNVNSGKPFSMVDTMKAYSYQYDVVHDRLNKLLSKNLGKVISLDLAKVPKGWDVEKWLYYIKNLGISVVDSFNEGSYGAATGKLAGGMNNASSGVIDAELGQSIASHIQTLEFIKNEMAEVAGITRQREGQISNRETVGGVERATMQSSHITEKLFMIHEDIKTRVLECFVETAKIAMRENGLKFQYILSDYSKKVMDVDGETFAECDYGLVVDPSNDVQEMNQQLDMLGQAAIQNGLLDYSTIIKMRSTSSIAEKVNIVKRAEARREKQQQQQQQMQQQMQEQQMQMQQQMEEARKRHEIELNEADNRTKIEVARIQAEAKIASVDIETPRLALEEKTRNNTLSYNAQIEKLNHNIVNDRENRRLKELALQQKTKSK